MTSGRLRFRAIRQSQLWRSIFRQGLPRNARERAAIVIGNVFLHLHPPRIAATSLRLRRTFCMGGLAFLSFLALTATGVLLMLHYRPTPQHAYGDIEDLMNVVPYGRFLRNLHRWSAHAMVVLVIAHMTRVFLAGAYRPPREFNWVIGVTLLVSTLFLSFTGYLLPWDQLAFWAVTVGTNMAAAVPLIGSRGPGALAAEGGDVKALLLGGSSVGAPALLRFYVLHCVLVPAAMGVLLSIHLFRVRRDGGVSAKY